MNNIYIYETPSSKQKAIKEGENQLIKIGETTRDPHKRIQEQLDTASAFSKEDTKYTLLYQTEANFSDKDIHKILDQKGIKKPRNNKEWYYISVEKVIHLIQQMKEGKNAEEIDIQRINNFKMRPEQKTAVEKTKKYFKTHLKADFLWNAKMRFGKTFAAYNLMKEMDFKRVLILTYKPAVHKQWKTDLEEHILFKEYSFVSAINNNINNLNKYEKTVCFMSYQDMIRTGKDNEIKEKHTEIYKTHWDLIIIDEFHYGTNTKKAKSLFEKKEKIELKIQLDENIQKIKEENLDKKEEEIRIKELQDEFEAQTELSKLTFNYKLFLSGTPFKALANNTFSEEQIFNWTYIDEQKAKKEWENKNTDKAKNPYEELPTIKLFVYQASEELITLGTEQEKDEFRLNYFFKAQRKGEDGKPHFGEKNKNNDKYIIKWLNYISGMDRQSTHTIEEELNNDDIEDIGQNFPYDHKSEISKRINHTLWYLPNVASVLAMKKLLEKHTIFEKYKIIAAVGGEWPSGADALTKLEPILEKHDKTITLSCGMLTTGVSVPKWSAVLFLRDIESPESYFQTAFRAQTPYKDSKGNILKKEAYIFDFSPNRSLKLLTEYSEKLSDKSKRNTSKKKIEEFIKYLPVLKISGNRMINLNAEEVLKFDYNKLDAIGLGQKFSDTRNIKINDETINFLSENKEIFDDIFNSIKKFSEFNGEKKEIKNKIDIGDIDTSNKRIKELKTKKAEKETNQEPISEEEKEIAKVEKKLQKEKERIRELLKTLLSRVPLFMYLTDASEENLEEVLITTERDLFRQATGLTSEQFKLLINAGLIKIDSMEGYILKYKEFEDGNFQNINEIIR